jgi:hypothetical protein
MSFFQNPFSEEWRGNLVMGDRQYSLTFSIPANKNKSDYMLAWANEPYDFTASATFTINYAFDVEFKNYSVLNISVSGAIVAATTAAEVVTALNANPTFSELWTASVSTNVRSVKPTNYTNTVQPTRTVLITRNPSRAKQIIRAYISSTGAEQKLRFNRYAAVAELPTYFERHTIANRNAYPDSTGMLIHLDESDPFTQGVIAEWGLVAGSMQADWQLLRGRSGIFSFQKITVDGSDRITQIIEYPAGAVAGDFARKIIYVYAAANNHPSQITEQPYTLTTPDLVTP